MTSDRPNPYASPEIAPPDENRALVPPQAALANLRQRGVIGMIVLTLITFGLYINIWVLRVSQSLNETLSPKRRISIWLVVAYWLVSLVGLLVLVLETIMDYNPGLTQLRILLVIADSIFAVVMAFTIRDRLNILQRVPRRDPRWFHGLWTFLFGAYYVQWKINRNLS